MTKTFAQKVRESYGDDIATFATRLSTLPITVERWENGQKLQETAEALLKYADKYALSMYPKISEDFAKMGIRSQLTELLDNFGENQRQFARRVGLSETNISRWIRLNIISPLAQRYIYEIACYPERFQLKQKSYKE